MGFFGTFNWIGMVGMLVIFFILFGWSSAVIHANPMLILVIIALVFFWLMRGQK
jgi:ACR3 family arsenite efflux pump ArsB